MSSGPSGKMTAESDAAHQEAEAFLRSGSGQSIAAMAAIVSQHRTMIQAQSADLHSHVANDTLLFTNRFPQSPGGGLQVKQAGGGITPDQSTDPADAPAPGPPGPSPAPGLNGGGIRPDASTPGPGMYRWCRERAAAYRAFVRRCAAPGSQPVDVIDGCWEWAAELAECAWWGWGQRVAVLRASGLVGWFRRFPGWGDAGGGGFGVVGDSAGGAVVGDGFRAWIGGWRDGGGGGPDGAASPDTPLTASVESAPVAAAPAAAPVSAPVPVGRPCTVAGCARWRGYDSVWVCVAAAGGAV